MHNQLLDTVERWRKQIDHLGVGGIINTLLLAFAPLAPFGAQLIYVAQPVVGLWVKRDTLNQWADLLENPSGVDWLRQHLTGQEDERD